MVFLSKLMTNFKFKDENDIAKRNSLIAAEIRFPNEEKVQQFIKLRNILERERKKSDPFNYDDIDSMDTYNVSELKTMMVTLYNRITDGRYNTVTRSLNSILELLFGEYLPLRGVNKCSLTLRDLKFTKKGEMPMSLLHFRLKTENKTTHIGTTRHKTPELCLIGAVAMNLWFRFDFVDGPLHGPMLPEFEDKAYYNYRLQYSYMSAMIKNISLTYECQLVEEALAIIGKKSASKTYLGRKNGVRLADRDSVDIIQIDRIVGGKQNSTSLCENTLGRTSLEFVMSKAGFRAQETYFVSRENMVPPITLQKKIFPWLEEAKERFERFDANAPTKDEFTPLFFDMLNEFRSVVLQDLVSLSQLAPERIFARHEINQDPEFLAFKERFDDIDETEMFLQSMKEPKDVVDLIIPRMAALHEDTKREIIYSHNTLSASFKTQIEKIHNVETHQNMSNEIPKLKRGLNVLRQDIFRIEQSNSRIEHNITRILHTLGNVPMLTPQGHNHGPLPVNMPSAITSPITEQGAPNLMPIQLRADSMFEYLSSRPEPELIDLLQTKNRNGKKEGTTKTKVDVPVSLCKMSKYIKTVLDLVKEWYCTGPFETSVTARNAQYGCKWRNGNSTKISYFRRRKVIKWIEMIRENGETSLTRNQAANLLECYRLQKGQSLHLLLSSKEELEITEMIRTVIELAQESDIEGRLKRKGLDFDELAEYESMVCDS